MSTSPRRGALAAAAVASALAVTLAGGLASSAAPGGSSATTDPNSDAATTAGLDRSSAIVQLSGRPLATSPRTAPGNGKHIDFGSRAVRAERARLAQERNALKQWLRANAPKAKVTGEYDVAVNAVAVRLNGTALETLRSAPGVVSAGYQGLYTPTADDPDLSLIHAQTAWDEVGGAGSAGAGVKVGIVDTGIDITHPCFADGGYPDSPELGDTWYTNDKVIVARVFNNKAGQQGLDPEAVQDHGTHVAGTVACNAGTPAMVDDVDIPYDPSGVAPAALLGNYNVFPGEVDNARSEDILDALQQAALDGMDVVNMSLGGGASGNQDLLTMAVDNLDRANVVVAVAAGNSGPGHYTVESPGSAERALTAGASSVGHFVGLPVSGNGVDALAATGDFVTPKADLTAPLGIVGTGGSLGEGCVASEYTNLTGKIALVSRGSCTFGTKVQLAQDAEAVAAVVVNNVAGDPTAMGADGVHNPSIPAVMAGLKDKAALVALATAGGELTIGSNASYALTGNDNIMAGFSSQGPTDVDFRVKPDVVAPGVNVLSSVPLDDEEGNSKGCDATTGCWAFFQGTSMATPHLAGAAAVVIGAHDHWDAWQVRSAVVNTAQQGLLKDSKTGSKVVIDPQIVGSGLVDVDAALGAQVTLSSVSTSFGAVPGRTGQPLSRQLAITNVSGAPLTVTLGVQPGGGFTVAPTAVTIGAGETEAVTLSFDPAGQEKGDVTATLRIAAGATEVAHSVLYAFVK